MVCSFQIFEKFIIVIDLKHFVVCSLNTLYSYSTEIVQPCLAYSIYIMYIECIRQKFRSYKPKLKIYLMQMTGSRNICMGPSSLCLKIRHGCYSVVVGMQNGLNT